jgi:tetratricopeptide (TPR) repeat protein/tRNA A-37 threonylcarbamoyl transferase component Bud32
MGVVYKARHLRLNRIVALKMVLAGEHAGPESMARFQAEAEAAARLRHPHIVPVHEVGRFAGLPYFTLEFVPGGPLSKRLAGRTLAAADAARLVELLARAVQHAHEQGVVHRDLKPANVLLEDGPDAPPGAWTPRITDFGLAKRLGDQGRTADGAVLGTPSYMAPEQARGDRKAVGPAADVYALGAVLYELLTGRPPFLAATSMETILQVLDTEPAPPRRLQPKTPLDLETICLKCLQKEPAKRYASAAALAEDLGRFREGRPIRARPAGALERAAKWARRRPVVAGLSALAAALTAAGVGAFAWAYGQALDQRDRALKAEGERQAQLARELAGSARLAAQRGDWEKALRDYEGALANGGEDPVDLRLGKLECLAALHQARPYRRELAALAGRADLGRHAGEVRLMQAYEMMASGKEKEGATAVGEALALKLPPADEAYAQALLAPTLPGSTRCLLEAVRIEPSHGRALGLLAPLLLLQGRIDEARVAVVQLKAAAPNSLSGMIVEALLLARDGEVDAAKALCGRLEKDYGPEGVNLYRDLVQLTADVTAEDSLWAAPKVVDVKRVSDLYHRFVKFARAVDAGADAGWGDFIVFTLPGFRDFAADPAVAGMKDPAQALRFVGDPLPVADAFLRFWPDGYFHYLRATVLIGQGKLDEAEAALLQALATPSLLRVQRRAQFELMRTRWKRAQKLRGPACWELRDQARRDLRRLVALGGEYPAWANQELQSLARDLNEDGIALTAARTWARQSPGDPRALELVFTNEYFHAEAADTARRMLQARPDDVQVANWVGLAERGRRYYRAALEAWLEALRLDPDNQIVRGNLAILENDVRWANALNPYLLEKLRLKEGLVLARRGRHAEAVKQARALVPNDAGGDALLALACVEALASAAAAGDAEQARQYAEDALGTLRKARDKGYFKDPQKVKLASSEADLKGLAGRPDFHEALGEPGASAPR